MCKVQVLSGTFTRGPMSAATLNRREVATGHVLACRTFPTSDLAVRLIPTTAAVPDQGRETP